MDGTIIASERCHYRLRCDTMITNYPRIISLLHDEVEDDKDLKETLTKCIREANWTPPYSSKPIETLNGFYLYLVKLLNSVPVDSTFDTLFHGLFYIVSQSGNVLQASDKYKNLQVWLTLYSEFYGSMLNTAKSANNLYSITNDPSYSIDMFDVPPGGYQNFNTFFSRHIRPGKRPIGTKTHPYPEPNYKCPLGPNPEEDFNQVHKNMCDDTVIAVPADSVYKGAWKIDNNSQITTSKGNQYSINELIRESEYSDRFKGGVFTHAYLTVYTYHRYHTPVRGKVIHAKVINGDVYANVIKDGSGKIGATDRTGYQFKQDRGLLIIDSPIGLVALMPIGMDFVSSCNINVDVGDYLNKGDEFGYFLFGGSDMIMLFENNIDIKLPKENMLYKLGQVFGTAAKNKASL